MLQSLTGIFVLIGFAWLISEKKSAFPFKLVGAGLALQLLVGFTFLKIEFFQSMIAKFNGLVLAIEKSTQAGTSMVFGYLGGAPLPFEEVVPGASFILAFKALPIILVISALSALLFYWKILPKFISLLSRLFEKTLKVGGAEGLGLAANIFIGMVESPLLIRPYIARLSRSELFSIMCCGMATVAGTVIVLYSSILSATVPDSLGHILIASVISIPSAFIFARIIVPGDGKITAASLDLESHANSAMEAITEGAVQGVKLLVYVIAMLVVMVALVELINLCLGVFPIDQTRSLTLQGIFGYVFAPVAWLIGIPWSEAVAAGALLGTKTVINEFVAYLDLAAMSPEDLSPSSVIIMTYALCGFANPGSLGIMIGGLTTMAPERKSEIIQLGLKSIVAGTLATCMTGATVNVILSI